MTQFDSEAADLRFRYEEREADQARFDREDRLADMSEPLVSNPPVGARGSLRSALELFADAATTPSVREEA